MRPRPAHNRAVRDGRCTKYLASGAGRCVNAALPNDIRCEGCAKDRKQWGSRLRAKRRPVALVVAAAVPLPDWMSNPSLLPKRPPGAKS